MLRGYRILVVLVVAAAFAISGCRSSKKSDALGLKGPVGPSETAKLPDWVNQGSGAFKKDDGKVIYGVGAQSGIQNYALLRRTADNQARVEIAKVLSTNVSSLAKSYARSAGDLTSSQEEQLVQDVSKSYSEAQLSGVQIIDHHYDIPTKTMFALGVLDIEAFTKLTQTARELPKALREHILKNADEAFKELDEQKKE